jgi:hypothetical protein
MTDFDDKSNVCTEFEAVKVESRIEVTDSALNKIMNCVTAFIDNS